MTESRYDWRELRMWRVIAVAALVWIPLWPVLTVVLVELHDFPRSLHSVVGAPVILDFAAVRRITSFECPECHLSFSMHERTGTHLTNKRCAHCGASIGT